LSDFLLRQVCGLRICAEDRAALEYLIGSLNEDGYLEDSLETLAQALGPENEAQQLELLHHLTVAHSLLLHCEPTGIGARNLAECLQLQLQAQQATPATEPHTQPIIAAALRICAQPLELLARRDIKQCVKRGVGNAALVRLAFAHIARLEPKPARQFVDVQRNIIVPDVLVRARRNARGLQQSGFEVQLNPAVMPRLQANSLYAKVLQEHRGSATSSAHAANSAHTANIANTAHAAGTAPTQGYAALQQNLQEARWFIKSIQQRFDTILRVCNAIVERQKGFLTHGEMAMRPLVMREIAEALDLHESTISRVVTAKYMSTPFGTYELRYFFGSSLTTDTGGNASSTAVRALIKQFIASENPTKPLSDQHIADLLEAQGIACARRTVAKYREGLKIATASLRKAL
jgi:RNA polymerase sigma-54 factor